MTNETRTTRKGREKPAPRIEPTYGTRSQRLDRKRREAEARNLLTPDCDRKANKKRVR